MGDETKDSSVPGLLSSVEVSRTKQLFAQESHAPQDRGEDARYFAPHPTFQLCSENVGDIRWSADAGDEDR